MNGANIHSRAVPSFCLKQFLCIYFGDLTPLNIAVDKGNQSLEEYFKNNGYYSEPTNNEEEKESKNNEEFANNAEETGHVPKSPALKSIKNILSSSQIKKYGKKLVTIVLPNSSTRNNDDQENNNNGNEETIQESCRNKSMKSLKVLIDKGIDVNSLNEDGETALHVACQNNWKEGVEFLIDKGADSTIHSKEGKLAKDLTNEEEILEILENE